jgi:hypothetical protein
MALEAAQQGGVCKAERIPDVAGALPLRSAAEERDRALVASVIVARAVEDHREATVRVLQVQGKAGAETVPKAAARARTGGRHQVDAPSPDVQDRHRARYFPSANGPGPQPVVPRKDEQHSSLSNTRPLRR